VRTIIVATGLTNEVLSSDHRYLSHRNNVGEGEIARVLGRRRNFGNGPLMAFLREAMAARRRGATLDLVFLEPGPEGGKSLVGPVAELAEGAHRIAVPDDLLPSEELARLFDGDVETRGLVVGCHTEQGVLSVATYLRCVLGCSDVGVSPHLVASATQDAHLTMLRHTLPGLGIQVFLDLAEVAEFAGLDAELFQGFDAGPCAIEPVEAREAIGDAQRIVELLCLQWTKASLRPLTGGFSGSLLYLANGWKEQARTEPMVLKIDAFDQMRRELRGYHQVKDFLGKHVPAFGYPVAQGQSMGVGMELAAMEGNPETLQDTFEAADGEYTLESFFRRLDKALDLLCDKLYRNTLQTGPLVPYRAFGLHTARQLKWLEQNTDLILGYLAEAGAPDDAIDSFEVSNMLRLAATNEDSLTSELCLSHGDLNYANIICDQGDNTWFIDWTHAGITPLELDFAKLENDAKFVISKDFEVEDLPRLRRFEEYLLQHRIPAELDALPDSLRFAKWDLRFRRILGSVTRIRKACFSLKSDDGSWLVYRIALMRYATHTLSFDQRRGRGECDVTQLAYALTSVDLLAVDLVSDDYHLRIRAERPDSYPPRQRISIDEAPWALESDAYDPPYHVDPSVLEADRSRVPEGWADPEDISELGDEFASRPAKRRDDLGRPLNPRGRTGLAGRGLLGQWGANPMVAAIVLRRSGDDGGLDLLLGRQTEAGPLELPHDFLRGDPSLEATLQRVLEIQVAADFPSREHVLIEAGYAYDARQTDHAWVEVHGCLLVLDAHQVPDLLLATDRYEELKWWSLGPDTINRLPSTTAAVARASIQQLVQLGHLAPEEADGLLARTG
jgi:ADP-ribose pyrophosphatase